MIYHVIQEIIYDKKEQTKLVQKNYIEFQKIKNGYKMLISYKEKLKHLLLEVLLSMIIS